MIAYQLYSSRNFPPLDATAGTPSYLSPFQSMKKHEIPPAKPPAASPAPVLD